MPEAQDQRRDVLRLAVPLRRDGGVRRRRLRALEEENQRLKKPWAAYTPASRAENAEPQMDGQKGAAPSAVTGRCHRTDGAPDVAGRAADPAPTPSQKLAPLYCGLGPAG